MTEGEKLMNKIKEGFLLRYWCRKCGPIRIRFETKYHNVNQLLGFIDKERLAEHRDPPHQDLHGKGIQNLRLICTPYLNPNNLQGKSN